MLRASIILLAPCLMLSVLAGAGNAQQPATPVPVTTAAAEDSAAALASTVADSVARADSTAMAKADSVAAAAAAPVAAGAAAGAAAAPAPTAATPAPAAAPTTTTPPPATTAPPAAAPASAAAAPASAEKQRRLYYGGTLGIDFFGDQTRFYIEPMVGISLTPRLSGGVKVGYERLKVKLPGDEDITSDNWGASVFGRLKVLPIAYAHVEYAMWRYETFDGHETVPYILVGGGLMKPIAPRVSLMVEVLYDVLQDDKSPYDSGEPWVSFGVGVGF